MLQASECRQRARTTLRGHMGEAVLVCFLGGLLGGKGGNTFDLVGNMGKIINNHAGALGDFYWYKSIVAVCALFVSLWGIFGIATFFLGSVIEIGMNKYFIKQAYGQEAELKDEFLYFSYFGKALGLRLVMGIFIVLWSLLLVIPGIIASYRYAMAPYIMAENPDIGVMEAIAQSKAMMKGHKWRLFCLSFSFIGWIILGIFTFGIGYLFLEPYMEASMAHFYLDLKTNLNWNIYQNQSMYQA